MSIFGLFQAYPNADIITLLPFIFVFGSDGGEIHAILLADGLGCRLGQLLLVIDEFDFIFSRTRPAVFAKGCTLLLYTHFHPVAEIVNPSKIFWYLMFQFIS